MTEQARDEKAKDAEVTRERDFDQKTLCIESNRGARCLKGLLIWPNSGRPTVSPIEDRRGQWRRRSDRWELRNPNRVCQRDKI